MSAGYISLVYSPLTLFRVRVKQIWCSHIGYRVLTFLIHISLTNAIYVCTQDRCVSCNKDLSKLKLPRLKYQWMVASKWMLLCNVTAWVRQHTNYWAAKHTALKHSLRGNCHWADSNRTSNDAQTRASYQDEMTKLVTDRHHNETLMILTQATSRTQSLICCITCSKAIKKTYQHEDSTCTQFQRKAKL